MQSLGINSLEAFVKFSFLMPLYKLITAIKKKEKKSEVCFPFPLNAPVYASWLWRGYQAQQAIEIVF